jgi:uncharacterized cupin superfamily protein
MQTLNIFSAERPEGSADTPVISLDVAGAVGSTKTQMFLYDLEPGQASRYHYEYDEEWLLVVDGTVRLRDPDGEHTLERGDLVRFPPGPAGAHRLMNRSESPARALMFSRSRSPAVVVYPDSDTLGVFFPDEANDTVFKRSSAVPWAEGEEDWYRAR